MARCPNKNTAEYKALQAVYKTELQTNNIINSWQDANNVDTFPTTVEAADYLRNKKLPVVKPGTQTRRFTHIEDTIKICFESWKLNKNRHYSIASKNSYSIIQLAKMFKSKTIYLPKRGGERYASALNSMNLNNKINKRFGQTSLKAYVKEFLEKHRFTRKN